MTIRLQVVTGGHPFVAQDFFAVFDWLAACEDVHWEATNTPTWSNDESARPDAILFYDMPGLLFTGGGDPPVTLPEPTAEQRLVFDRLREAGVGLVFMHHAVASWPAWDGFADMVGGRFHYQPATLRGVHYPDSGYVFDVEHTIDVIDPTHPICEGLGDSFSLTDELYCSPVFEDEVIPLMRTRFPVDDPRRFYSADQAIRGRRNSNEGWTHPAGSDLVAWVKRFGDAPLAYIQFGDGPVTYRDDNFRRVVRNAVLWAASSQARDWARNG
jgi:type 1 glutamine amidotransferase